MSGTAASKVIKKAEIGVFERYAEKFSMAASEEAWFQGLLTKCSQFEKGHRLALQGRADSSSHFLKSGWAYTATDHGDGSRTVFDIHLPGDFIISPGVLTVPRKSTLVALTDCELATLDVNEMSECSRQSPTASNFMLHLLGHQHEVLADRVVQTTRMSALTRVSCFYLNLLQRLRAIAPSVDKQFVSPITQNLLSEILGMSEVHVSRTMLRLRSLKVLTVTNRVVEYLDIEKLEQLSTMQDDYSVAA